MTRQHRDPHHLPDIESDVGEETTSSKGVDPTTMKEIHNVIQIKSVDNDESGEQWELDFTPPRERSIILIVERSNFKKDRERIGLIMDHHAVIYTLIAFVGMFALDRSFRIIRYLVE